MLQLSNTVCNSFRNQLFNTLMSTIITQYAPSLPVFRRELKTVLYRSSFPDVI